MGAHPVIFAGGERPQGHSSMRQLPNDVESCRGGVSSGKGSSQGRGSGVIEWPIQGDGMAFATFQLQIGKAFSLTENPRQRSVTPLAPNHNPYVVRACPGAAALFCIDARREIAQ